MEALIKPTVFLVLVIIGYFRGRRNEQEHLISLHQEEQAVKDVMIFATRYPDTSAGKCDPVLVSGSAVVSSDYFRFLIANLRKFLGGSYSAYESLNERARRQAIVRMKQEARKNHADRIFNMRVNTSRISHPREGGTPQIEVHVYGTALIPANGTVAESKVHFRAEDYPVPAEPQNAIKHPVSLFCVYTLLLLIIYSLFDMATDRMHLHHWRYVNGAPWLFYSLAAAVFCGAIFREGRKKKAPVFEISALSLMLLPALCFSFYFLVIRLTGMSGSTVEKVTYTVLQDGMLQPPAASAFPLIDPGDYRDYWQGQKPGSTIDITITKTLIGVYLYDMAPLRDGFEKFYNHRP